MKSSQITVLAYVTMTLLFGAALSQVVAPFNPFSSAGSNDSSDDNSNNDNSGTDPDTNANPLRQIFAQGYVGGALPVGSVTKVPLIMG